MPLAPPVGYPPVIYMVEADNFDHTDPTEPAPLASGTVNIWCWVMRQHSAGYEGVCEVCGDTVTALEWWYRSDAEGGGGMHLACARREAWAVVMTPLPWPR